MTYLEPFFGSGAVFFNKNRSRIETINDLDGNVVNLFKVIREHPKDLARQIEFTPWSRDEHQQSYEITGDPLEDARRFLVRMWQGQKSKVTKSGWRNNIIPDDTGLSRWGKLSECIFESSKRLLNAGNCLVQIENKNAIELIQNYKRDYVFIYCDPPYVLSTRAGRMYNHEMKDKEHIDLLNVLLQHPGPVMISGYESDIYNDMLQGWKQDKKATLCEIRQERVEVIWMNYEAIFEQISLIG